MTDEDFARLFSEFNCNPAVSVSGIREFERANGFRLPEEFTAFLRRSNGGEGFVGPAYLILWKLEHLAERNAAYEVYKYVPGCWAFGTDGGGEIFGFDTRSRICSVIKVPAIGMGWEVAVPVGVSFDRFISNLKSSSEASG
jgi:hypothetical protein